MCSVLCLFVLNIFCFLYVVVDLGFNPCLIVHHGGHWTVDDGLVYAGGKVSVFEDIAESVTMSYVKGITNSLQYNDIKIALPRPYERFLQWN